MRSNRRMGGAGMRRGLRGGSGVASAAPAIDLVPWIGDTATVTPGGSTYQWQRDGVDIGGATSQTYQYVAADIGPAITCVVNGVATAAVQTYFTHVADRTGAVSDLAACWDTRDLTPGAVTTWTDRVAAYVFSGTGTCDTSINSKKTLVLNGTTNGFTTTGNVSNLSGASAHTTLFAGLDTYAGGAGVILEYSTNAASNSAFLIYCRNSGTTLHNFIRSTVSIEYNSSENLATAAVYAAIGDYKLSTGEPSQIWKNGNALTTAVVGSENNNAPTATMGDYTLSLGQRSGGSLRWVGKLVGAIPVFRRALTWEERSHAELILGYLSGISVSVVAAPAPGIAFGMAGQSNSVGRDTNLTGLPGTWPPADTAAKLKNFTGTSTVALVEPVNGSGGTHAVSFADAIIRAAGYSSQPLVTIAPAPPISSTSITQWVKGTTNYNNMLAAIYTMKARGYRMGGLLWYQGETDAIALADANNYLSRTQQMFADLRADLLEPALRIVAVRIHPTNPDPPNFLYWTNIRTAQLSLADSNTIVVDASGTLIPDNVHLSTLAEKALGETMATAYLAQWPA